MTGCSGAGSCLIEIEGVLGQLLEHGSDLLAVVDAGGLVSYVSPSVGQLLGRTHREIIGRPLADLIRGDGAGAAGELLVGLRAGEQRRFPDRMRPCTSTEQLVHADGGARHVELVVADHLDDPPVSGYVVMGRDVTERRLTDLRLRHAGLHDSLTHLPNRALLIQEVESRLIREGGRGSLAVIVIGVDRFKLVNESLGHEMGDHLLVAVGRRLRRQVRTADTVARLDGDTFVVTTTGVTEPEGARSLAGRLIAVAGEPYELAGRRIAVTAGAGVALSGPGDDGATLVRNADTALYAAKRAGRGRVELFDPGQRAKATRLLAMEQALGQATRAGQLRVHFQPIVALGGELGPQAVVGVEALVRWAHPELGLVPPFDFIPLAEDTGHIVEIGSWVLEESCRTLMSWAAGGEPLCLAVNLSPRQLVEPDLPATVAGVLGRTGFPPSQLTMEVTESVLVEDGPYATEVLQQLRRLGVRLSIDDFGTGYSSLLYLRRLNADELKIDRSFVDGLGRDSEADTIVTTVIGLARSLNLNLVAEGVETDEQRRLLVELGCRFAQGFLFSRPLPAVDFELWRSAGGDSVLAS